MNAFVLGATGLVAGFILEHLAASDDYAHIVAPVRRSTGNASDKLIEIPFDAEGAADWDPPVEIHHAFIAFGTTKKAAGGINAQRDIEVRLPRLYLKRLRELRVRHISLCSALGADWESTNAYNAMKGQLEEDIRMMRFPSFVTFRPSVLGGHRPGDERPAEAWAQRAMAWLPKAFRTIPAEHVAEAMVRKAAEEPEGMTIIRSGKIWNIVAAEKARTTD